jgi:hypothetical protein
MGQRENGRRKMDSKEKKYKLILGDLLSVLFRRPAPHKNLLLRLDSGAIALQDHVHYVMCPCNAASLVFRQSVTHLDTRVRSQYSSCEISVCQNSTGWIFS